MLTLPANLATNHVGASQLKLSTLLHTPTYPAVSKLNLLTASMSKGEVDQGKKSFMGMPVSFAPSIEPFGDIAELSISRIGSSICSSIKICMFYSDSKWFRLSADQCG